MTEPRSSCFVLRWVLLLGVISSFCVVTPAFARSPDARKVKRTKTVVGHRKVTRSKSHHHHSSSSSSSSSELDIVAGILDIFLSVGELSDEFDEESEVSESTDFDFENDSASDPGSLVVISTLGTSFRQIAPRGDEFVPALSSYVGVGVESPNLVWDFGFTWDSNLGEENSNFLKIDSALRLGPDLGPIRIFGTMGLGWFMDSAYGQETVSGLAWVTGAGVSLKLGGAELGAIYDVDFLSVPKDHQPYEDTTEHKLVGTRHQVGMRFMFSF